MLIVTGYDHQYNARVVEVEGVKEEIQKILEEQGWTNLVFHEK